MTRRPSKFQLRPVSELKPKDKIWYPYDGERTVRSIEDTLTGMVYVVLWNGKKKRYAPAEPVYAYTPSEKALEERLAAAVAAVESWSTERHQWWGSETGPSAQAQHGDASTLHDHVRSHNRASEVKLSDDFGTADLQRAAKRGLIVMRERTDSWNRRTVRDFTSLAAEAEAAAERELTDQQRLDRFMASFVEHYENGRVHRGDRPDLWPAQVSKYGDGLHLAEKAGLVILVDARIGSGKYYVPASHYEAYAEALALYEDRQAKAQAHFQDVERRLLEAAGGPGRGREIRVPLEAAERLLDLLEGSGGD